MDQMTGMRVFCAVVELESFSRAADQLGIARSMATKHVAALEDRLGARLLNRTTRRLSRTEAGQAYHERCRELLAEIDALDESLRESSQVPRGTLRVTGPVSFGVRHLGGAAASFIAAHPQARIDLVMSDRLVDLVEEGLDLAVRVSRLVDSSLVARRVSSTRFAVCASPAYLAARGAPAHPRELSAHACLAYAQPGMAEEWRAEGPQGARATVRVPWAMRANNGDVLRAAALEGAGIVVQPTFLVGQDLAEGRLVELLPQWRFGTLGVHAVYPHRRHLSAKVRAFVQHLERVLPREL